jgi:hypothetical protein
VNGARAAGLILVIGCAALAFWATRPAPPASTAVADEPREEEALAPVAELPEPAHPPPTVAPAAPPASGTSIWDEPEGEVRMAPGPVVHEVVDPPTPGTEGPLPPPDPEIRDYQIRAQHVGPQQRLAYAESSIRMLDTTIDALTQQLRAAGATSPDGRALSVRIARMQSQRAERVAERDQLRAEVAALPASERWPEEESAEHAGPSGI